MKKKPMNPDNVVGRRYMDEQIRRGQPVPTLEVCRTLKRIGFSQDTTFCWAETAIPGYRLWNTEALRNHDKDSRTSFASGRVAAPSLQEMMDRLPSGALNNPAQDAALLYIQLHAIRQ